MRLNNQKVLLGVMMLTPIFAGIQTASAVPVAGGTLDPLTIPKYVTPLVIPPVMNLTTVEQDPEKPIGETRDVYDIAVRQFKQQILPGGIWNTLNGRADAFPATTVWSYGPEGDPVPDSTTLPDGSPLGGAAGVAPAPNSQFNYPAYTMENIKDRTTRVNWINDLVDADGNALPHLFAVDQSLHWANPAADCLGGELRTDCMGTTADPYTGPVPIITHVHGAHTASAGDGYTEAWWLPDANNITCVDRDPVTGVPVSTPTGLTQVTYPDGSVSDFWEVVCEGTIANLLTNRHGNVVENTNNPDFAGQGAATFGYHNDQPSATLWYHDHSLGMTRLNVMAGPAGFWLVRDNELDAAGFPLYGSNETGLSTTSILPGPAPVAGEGLLVTNVTGRHNYREIPIVIQGRSFDMVDAAGNVTADPLLMAGAELFYPDNRAFFEGLNVPGQPQQFPGAPELQIDLDPLTSDIAPIWNPEAFFNTMVVNGVTWPKLEVAPAQYRFRLLNGSNSRFINLALKIVDAEGKPVTAEKIYYERKKNELKDKTVKISELDFYQIGAEQSLKPTVTAVRTGFATNLTAETEYTKAGLVRVPTKQSTKEQALLLGLAERADVIVDFRGLPDGTIITMTNTAPDAPFGGFPDVPADPSTTGQVMQFVVNSAYLGFSTTDELRDTGTYEVTNPLTAATNVQDLVVDPVALDNFAVPGITAATRELALVEEESTLICADVDVLGNVVQLVDFIPGNELDGTLGSCVNLLDPMIIHPTALPFAPKAAVLGTVQPDGSFTVTLWSDPIVTNVNADGSGTETAENWNLWNFTVDGHPIHVHLVKFKVLGRTGIIAGTSSVVATPTGAEAWEDGWKDTVITYPGEITSIAADFDINGLYVWHCHIVEHEDNEMMVPMCVGEASTPAIIDPITGLIITPAVVRDCPAQLF